MASRVNRKNASVAVLKGSGGEKTATKIEPSAETVGKSTVAIKSPGIKNTSVGKKLAKKSPPKKLLKKPSIAINLKAKTKKAPRLNQKLAKTILQNAKTLENRKKLLKNGVKEVKPRKRKVMVKKEKDDQPPVLEPIFPIEENIENKKQPKKRLTKKALKANADLLDVKKIKVENDDNISISSDVTDISNEIPLLPKQVRKPRAPKKPKIETDTLEDVMNDLSFLIKGEKDEIKKEVDSMSESGKSETTSKPKKLTKRQRIELLKKKIVKKENIENTLSKLDSSDEKVIDMLDLNVMNIKKKTPQTKRRHSIEKFPMSTSDMDSTETPIPQLTLFNQLPRSISPRSKRNTKVRQSVDGICRRSSPYTTRSDSPARILRNGKQRKLKDLNLLEGLDSDIKKRKRLCSDLSGSEMSVSKLSGYESDSSFSDLASLPGTENSDLKELDSKCIPKELYDRESDTKPPCVPGAVIKGTPSSDTATNGPSENIRLIDTNSNLCNNVNSVDVSLDMEIKNELSDESTLYLTRPSMKVPEKSVILDIMKQTFNDVNDDKSVKCIKKADEDLNFDTEAVLVSKFYGKSTALSTDEDRSNDLVPTVDATNTPLEEDLKANENVEPIIGEFPTVLTDESSSCAVEPELTEKPPCLEEPLPTEELVSVEEPASKDEEMAEEQTHRDVQIPAATEQQIEIDSMEISTVASVEECHVEKFYENKNIAVSSEPTYEENILMPALENIETDQVVRESGISETAVRTSVLESTEDVLKEAKESVDKPNELEEQCDDKMAEELTEEDRSEPSNGNSIDLSESAQMEVVEESAEELAEKENILKALGLQSLRQAEQIKHKPKEKAVSKNDSYTGTLKTVIKINRDKKKGRNSFKMTLQKNKGKLSDGEQGASEDNYKIMKECTSTAWKQGNHSSDTAGAHRKSHYSNRSNMDGSSEHTSDGETPAQDGAIKALVIPEKASSFSIHPGRLCKDECSYCFGKFGLFDTPCHIAQIKNVDRQNKILATEKHLTTDSCLCDACYRHVDRKSNTPSYTNKSLKRNSLVAPGPRQNHCHVLGCNRVSSNILRRKWIIKMRKSICQVINIDLDNPGLHSIPICEEHYAALEHLMVCAMCKRRLARNHIHYLGPETNDLNNALNDEGIPLMLTDKPVVCKLCKCFASVMLKDPEERPENSTNFFREYKRRLLHFNDIVPMDEAAAEEPIAVPSKADRSEQIKKKNKKLCKISAASDLVNQGDCQDGNEIPEKIQERVPSTDTNSQPQSRSESPSDEYNSIDYNTLIPAIAMDCGSDTESKKEPLRKPPIVIKKLPPRIESIKDAVEISKVTNHNKHKNSDVAVQRLGSNPSISVRQLFPGEEDLPVNGHIEFSNVKDRTPEGWEKCTSVIQYDAETKRLWQELQKPYGNQSSFLRHLILLEKYFRNGDLILSPNASHHSINYSESVHNRLRAYDNIPTSAGNIQPLSMLPFNKMQKSNSGIITSTNVPTGTSTSTSVPSSMPLNSSPAVSVTTVTNSAPRSTPLTLSQLNSPPLIPANAILQQVRPKMVGAPPGLISLHPGTSRPVAPLVKVPQSQKIKFPIPKNWRPNLIPIDPTKKQERKAGLVQVISGGKPYHITLEDYKKMCAIKRSFEMKQKRLLEAQNAKPILVTHNSVLKSIIPRKGLIISKTATVTSPLKSEITPPQNNSHESENILEKLDKQVEKLESKLNEKPSSLLLPKIPKSLTVIPQTITRKPSRPSSPALLITPKSNANASKS